MNKKYIIAAILTIIVWIVFMVIRHYKHAEEARVYNEETKSRMVEMFKKGRITGLPEMGDALKKYYSEHEKYPDDLKELYPDYIAFKPLIDEIDWRYEPKGDNFLLTKTIKVGGQIRTASIDKSLKPRSGSGIMVASVNDINQDLLSRENISDTPSVISRIKRVDTGVKEKEKKAKKILKPEVVSIVKGEIGLGVNSNISNTFLVWKDKNGTIGFGNREYPTAPVLSTYEDGKWFHLKTLYPKRVLSDGTDDTQAWKMKNKEQIAKELRQDYLVWKNKNGDVGFGNVAYPRNRHVSMFSQDQWVEKKMAQINEPEQTHIRPESQTNDSVLLKYSGKYLVWKDQDGNIGLGDIAYPPKDVYSYDNGEWLDSKPPQRTNNGLNPIHESAETKKDATQIASDYSNNFLIWKNDQGNIGFGNLSYPHSDEIARFDQDTWVKDASTAKKAPSAKHSQPAYSPPSSDEIAAKYSDSFLVWKDKSGTIHYSDLAYPDTDKMYQVCVDGVWQTVNN